MTADAASGTMMVASRHGPDTEFRMLLVVCVLVVFIAVHPFLRKRMGKLTRKFLRDGSQRPYWKRPATIRTTAKRIAGVAGNGARRI
jgi:uncharacterized protein (UPF0333 family)